MEQIPQGLIPIALFGHVRENQTDTQEWASWPDLAEQLQSSSQNVIAAKEDAILFCSTHFTDGRRAAKNAIHSGMLLLDVDNGATVDDTIDIFEKAEISGLIYTTASHSDDQHKFRICVPLTETVSPKGYTLAWFGLNAVFGGIADVSKKTCESMFYVPGHLEGRTGEFHDFDGDILSAEDWASLAPPEEIKELKKASKSIYPNQRRSMSHRRRLPMLEPDDVNGVDICRNPIVPSRAIDKYLNRSDNWHHARFSFMCSVACKAVAHNYDLSTHELVGIFNDIDREDGGHYTGANHQQEIQNDATKALNNAT
jgi:hypothetical protein